MMEIDETNEVMMNHYKKQELIKAKKRLEEKMSKSEILRLANKRFITEDEIKEALGFDYIEDPKPPIKEQENIVDEVDYVIEDEEIYEPTKKETKIEAILIEDSKLEDYPNQPFKLYDEDKRKEMIESIKNFEIMQPLIVRPIKDGKYQILAGHNRRSCARELGITKYPCIIKENLSDDEAKIYLIDTNLCTRDKISPMERARAYKIKYDTYKKRNIETSMVEEIRKDNIKINDSMAQKIRKESENNKREDYYNFLVKEDILELIKPRKKVKENEENYVSVKFYEDEIDRYFGVINDIDELKRRIIYSLEETYIKK